MRVYKISALEANQRLDKYLHKLLKEAGNGFIFKMLRKKNITLNGKKAAGNESLKEGDEIKLFMAEETLDKFMGHSQNVGVNTLEYEKAYQQFKNSIQIVYEDENILLLNKPAGILSQKAEEKDLSCNEWLIGYLLHKSEISALQLNTFKPSVCNRLDRNTSGLLICGKTLLGSQKMSQMIKDRSIKKFYRTFVKGSFSDKLHIDGYIKKDKNTNKVSITKDKVPGSDRIETVFIPLESSKKLSYIEVELITGKPHQIRAHIASENHAILGDYKYGDAKFNQNTNRKHQLLHAYRLEFPKIEGTFANLSEKVFIAKEPPYFEEAKMLLR